MYSKGFTDCSGIPGIGEGISSEPRPDPLTGRRVAVGGGGGGGGLRGAWADGAERLVLATFPVGLGCRVRLCQRLPPPPLLLCLPGKKGKVEHVVPRQRCTPCIRLRHADYITCGFPHC